MSYSYDDCGYADVYKDTVRKARKQHKCTACSKPILPGHYYVSHFSVNEGQADTIKRCGACELTFQHLKEIGKKVGMFPAPALDCGLDYEEEWGTEPPDDIADLVFLSPEESGQLLAPKKEDK